MVHQRIAATLIQVAAIFFLWYNKGKGGNYLNLVEEYFVLANEVVSWRGTVYDGVTAEKHNCKVKRMGTIATEIEQNFPELKNDFYQLLSNNNKEIHLWAAHHILEHMNCDQPMRKNAIKEIRRMARTDRTAYGFGEKVWLKEWYKNHPRDRWI